MEFCCVTLPGSHSQNRKTFLVWNTRGKFFTTEFAGGSREISEKPNGSVRKLHWQIPWYRIRKRN